MDDLQTAYFGGGCFWCTEAVFQRVKGVKEVIPGYAGGHKENPTYDTVSLGNTGHAEIVKIVYDPEEIKFKQLLDIFWYIHDPTSIDKQGNDFGPQYRSLILYTNEDQKITIDESIKKLQKKYEDPIVTEVKPFTKFFQAESHHIDYYKINPKNQYCRLIIDPKIKKLLKKFPDLQSS